MKIEIKIEQGNLELVQDRNSFTESLTSRFGDSELKSLGFESKDKLSWFIRELIFTNFSGKYPKIKLDGEKCKSSILQAVDKCSKILGEHDLQIHIFPTYSDFVIEKMGGSVGFCVNKGVIFIGLYPKLGWEESLKKTLAHEFAHAISDYYDMSKLSVAEGLVFDGLAENFCEEIYGQSSLNISQHFTKEESLKIYAEIKSSLDERSFEKYSEVFFGTGKYPGWAGYAIGYYLVKDFLRSNKSLPWRRLLAERPEVSIEQILIK